MKTVFVGLFLFYTLVASSASLCVPGTVPAVTLHPNNTLTWKLAYNPNNCIITNYVVNVLDRENGTQFQFQTNSSTFKFDGAFLDMCTTYIFELRALTRESVLGPSYQYVATTSPIRSMNLNWAKIYVHHLASEITMNWTLEEPKSEKCISYYRVIYWDEKNEPKDVYVTSKNFTLKEATPCASYNFRLTSIISNPDWLGATAAIATGGGNKVPSVPSLVSLSATSNSVNMIWKLESYNHNHCPLSKLNVYTLGAPANSSVKMYNIIDNVMRPNVNVTITDLSPNNVYISYVNVMNNLGTSTNVTVTYQTTSNFGHFKYSVE